MATITVAEAKHLKDEEVLNLSMRNPALFEVIVDRHEEAFLRKAKSILRDEDALDAVQETFVRIYAAGKRFKVVPGATFLSWAYKILTRQCMTIYAKRKKTSLREVQVEDELFEIIPDQSSLDEQQLYVVRDEMMVVISKLPALFQRIIKAFFYEEKSHKEIAKAEGISEQSARTSLHRAKTMMKKLLEIHST